MLLPFLAFIHHQSSGTLIRWSCPKQFVSLLLKLSKTKHQLLGFFCCWFFLVWVCFCFFLVVWRFLNTWCARFSSCLQDYLSNTEKCFLDATGSAAFPLGGMALSAKKFFCHCNMTNTYQHNLIYNRISAHISITTQHSYTDKMEERPNLWQLLDVF